MNHSKIAIIIVNYKTPQLTLDCLDSIEMNSVNFPVKIFLVDNHSDDNSLLLFKNYIQIERTIPIELIASPENNGFAAGNNLAIQKAKQEDFDYFILLNSDTLISPDILNHLNTFLSENPDCDIVACCVNNKQQQCEHTVTRARPTFWNLIFLYQSPFWNKTWFPGYKKHFMMNKNKDMSFSVFTGNAACMLLKKDFFIKTGLLDENTFLFFEEFIIGEKAKNFQMNVCYMPKPGILHYGGESTKKARAFSYIEFCKSEKYYMRNYRNFGWLKISTAKIFRTTGFLLRSLRNKEYRSNVKKFFKEYLFSENSTI